MIKLDQLREMSPCAAFMSFIVSWAIVGSSAAGLDLHDDAHQLVGLEAVFRQRGRHELLDLREQLEHLLHLLLGRVAR